MVELIARLALAAGLLGISAATETPNWELSWKLSLVIAALAIVRNRLEARKVWNGGIAGWMAIADAFWIAFLVAGANRLNSLGFLALLPLIDAVARFQASGTNMAPLVAVSLFVAHSVVARNPNLFSPNLLIQIGATLGAGLLLGLVQPHRIIERVIEVQTPGPASSALSDLREANRKLQTAHEALERKSTRPLMLAGLEDIRGARSARFYPALAQRLMNFLKARGLAIYQLSQFEESMVVRAVAGGLGSELSDAMIRVNLKTAISKIEEQSALALRSLLSETESRKIANVILLHERKALGMICVAAGDADELRRIESSLQDLAPTIASFIAQHERMESLERRALSAELLYNAAIVTNGATTRDQFAQRAIQELWDSIEVDHLSLGGLTDSTAMFASLGQGWDLLSRVRFASGEGPDAWLAEGAPEIYLFDARGDARFDSADSVRLRIGSLAICPITDSSGCVGYLAAATHRQGGLSHTDLESLRLVASEAGRALARLAGEDERPSGVMNPAEFQTFVQESDKGSLVLLEVLKREALEETFGKPALSHAYRQLTGKLRAKLPTGGALCQRQEGGFVAFLPQTQDHLAEAWANDVAATASLLSLRTPDGARRIPLGLRAKVARLDRQESEIFAAEAS